MINKHLGYYTCDGLEFSSKVDALLCSKKSGKPVNWIFNNLSFDNYPWHIEPQETLDELYDKRARELREKYDYVILSFSGGSDTNNILESFIRQGLHIDEVVTNHITNATKSTTVLDPSITKSWNFAAEHELQAVPRLKYIQEKLPRTKITVLDVSPMVIDSMNQFDDVDWVLHRNDHLSIGQLFRFNYFHFSDIKRKLDKNLKVCIIIGIDKPKTNIKGDNNFYIYFNDATANIVSTKDFNPDYTNTTVELFYWSPDALPILCKQAHVIKRWLEQNPNNQQYWRSNNFALVRMVHEKALRSLIYTTWDERWFQADKSTSWFNTEYDEWFKNNKSMSRELHMWKQGINYLVDQIPDQITYDKHGNADALKQFKYEYKIGKMKPNFLRLLK